MVKKRLVIPLILSHLFVQLSLTLISSLHWFLLVICLLAYLTLLSKEYFYSKNSVVFSNHYLSSIIFTIIHFIFVLSYNKILPWEIGLVVLFLLLILHYARRLGASIFILDLSWLPFVYQQEYESTNSIVINKYLLTNILLFAYTCQLCLTTVCTPSIYLNWFLIVTDCRYVYSYILSSYTFSGAILVSIPWTILSFVQLVLHRLRS